MNPAITFGHGCVESNGVECTKCTAPTCCAKGKFFDTTQSTPACSPCSGVFGDLCAECVEQSCLNCSNGVVAPDGTCKSCSDEYGDGCETCDQERCLTLLMKNTLLWV